jgi:hypothetical protein
MSEKIRIMINNFVYPTLTLVIASTVAFMANFFFVEYPNAMARIEMNASDINEQKAQIVDELKEIRQTQRDIINILMKKGADR